VSEESLTTNVDPVPWVSAGEKSSRPGSMAPNSPRHSPHKSLTSGLTSWQPRSNTVTNWEITGSTISLSKTCFSRASCRTNNIDQGSSTVQAPITFEAWFLIICLQSHIVFTYLKILNLVNNYWWTNSYTVLTQNIIILLTAMSEKKTYYADMIYR